MGGGDAVTHPFEPMYQRESGCALSSLLGCAAMTLIPLLLAIAVAAIAAIARAM